MFWIIVLLHNLSSLELEITNWWPDILLQDFLIEYRIYGSINNGKLSRLCSCKAASDHYTTTTMFDWWYDVLFMKSCVSFTPDVMGHTPFKKLISLISPQNICPKVLGIIKKLLANVRQAIVFFLVNSGFFLGTLAWMSFLPSLFLIVESWTLTLIEASEACSSLDVILFCFFYDLLDGSSLRSWSNFGRPATPGKIHHCYTFSPFMDNGSDHGSLESQSFRNYFITIYL